MLEGFAKFTIFGLPQGLISILIIALAATLFQLLVYKFFSDQKKIKEIKERQKEIKVELKKIRAEENPEKFKQLNTETVKLSGELLRLNLKPTLLTLLPLLLLIYVMKNLYTSAGVGNIISWGANLPIVGDGAGWLLSFIIFTLILNLLFRKLLNIY